MTLLWKAGLQHVELEAVEGFVPEQEDAVPGARPRRRARLGARRGAADWDLPARALDEATEAVAREVPEAEKERLRAEEASHALPANAVRAVVAMLEAVADQTDPTSFEDVAGFVGEVRDFLLAEGQLAPLTDLVRALGDESKLAAAQAAPDAGDVRRQEGDRQDPALACRRARRRRRRSSSPCSTCSPPTT